MADSLIASNGMRYFHPHAPMTRKVTRKQKSRGKQGTVGEYGQVIRVPRGGLSVAEIKANLTRFVAGKHPNTVWNFTSYPRYVQVIASRMGIR